MASISTEYLLTGTATNLTTIMSAKLNGQKQFATVNFRAVPGAAIAFFGNSDVTTTTNRGGAIQATDLGSTILWGVDGRPINTDFIYLVGTAGAGNIILITLVT